MLFSSITMMVAVLSLPPLKGTIHPIVLLLVNQKFIFVFCQFLFQFVHQYSSASLRVLKKWKPLAHSTLYIRLKSLISIT